MLLHSSGKFHIYVYMQKYTLFSNIMDIVQCIHKRARAHTQMFDRRPPIANDRKIEMCSLFLNIFFVARQIPKVNGKLILTYWFPPPPKKRHTVIMVISFFYA